MMWLVRGRSGMAAHAGVSSGLLEGRLKGAGDHSTPVPVLRVVAVKICRNDVAGAGARHGCARWCVAGLLEG